MPSNRRQLIRRAAAGTLVLGAIAVAPSSGAASPQDGALVIVRTDRGVQALDPRLRSMLPWNGPIPTAALPDAGTPAPVPLAVATPVTEGAIGYWMASPRGDAFVFRVDTGAAPEWWWRLEGSRARQLDLPGDLEPAFPSGASARWFHGATIDAAHLGSGTLRLLAVDVETGQLVLDHVLDRRLELAATAVSDDGAIVAQVQSSTTGVAFWAADLRGETREFDADMREDPGAAAASAIDLRAIADGDAVLVAAALAWDWSGAPKPMVYVMYAWSPETVHIIGVPGELIGIVPDVIT